MTNTNIIYRDDVTPDAEAIIELYNNCGLPRPTNNKARIEKMYAHANLIITAWDGDLLVGVSRSLTDFSWCCYLADLAVREGYKKHSIGKTLVELTRKKVSEDSMVLLLSVPTAMEYYPKIGMEKVENGFIIHRKPY